MYVRRKHRITDPNKNNLKSAALGETALLVNHFSLVSGNKKQVQSMTVLLKM